MAYLIKFEKFFVSLLKIFFCMRNGNVSGCSLELVRNVESVAKWIPYLVS